MQNEVCGIENRIKGLMVEKESLNGFFAMGKKKEIERMIEDLNQTRLSIESSIGRLNEKLKNVNNTYTDMMRKSEAGNALGGMIAKGNGSIWVDSRSSGRVHKILVQPGDRVAKGDIILILEELKFEIPVNAPAAGIIRSVDVRVGEECEPGKIVATMD